MVALEGPSDELLDNDDVRLIYLGAWHETRSRRETMPIWNPEYETHGPRGARGDCSCDACSRRVAWVYERVPYYREAARRAAA